MRTTLGLAPLVLLALLSFASGAEEKQQAFAVREGKEIELQDEASSGNMWPDNLPFGYTPMAVPGLSVEQNRLQQLCQCSLSGKKKYSPESMRMWSGYRPCPQTFCAAPCEKLEQAEVSMRSLKKEHKGIWSFVTHMDISSPLF